MASGSRPPRPRRAKGSAAGAHRPQAAFGAKGPYGGPLGGAWTKGLAHHLLSSPSRGEPLFTAGGWERAVRAEKRGFFGPALGSPPSSAVFWGAALLARCLLHRCCQPPSFYPRPIPRRAAGRGSLSSCSARSSGNLPEAVIKALRWGRAMSPRSPLAGEDMLCKSSSPISSLAAPV